MKNRNKQNKKNKVKENLKGGNLQWKISKLMLY